MARTKKRVSARNNPSLTRSAFVNALAAKKNLANDAADAQQALLNNRPQLRVENPQGGTVISASVNANGTFDIQCVNGVTAAAVSELAAWLARTNR